MYTYFSRKINKEKKGFTLVELIVTVAILGILSAGVIPKVSAETDRAKETGVDTDFRSFYTGLKAMTTLNDPSEYSTTALLEEKLNENLDVQLRFRNGLSDSLDAWGGKYELHTNTLENGNTYIVVASKGNEKREGFVFEPDREEGDVKWIPKDKICEDHKYFLAIGITPSGKAVGKITAEEIFKTVHEGQEWTGGSETGDTGGTGGTPVVPPTPDGTIDWEDPAYVESLSPIEPGSTALVDSKGPNGEYVPDGYTLPKDSDFEWVEASGAINAHYEYKGWNAEYLVIPHKIAGKNVATYEYMFNPATANLKGVASNNTAIANTEAMFNGTVQTELDLTYFNASNITNTNNMFKDAMPTLVYVRNQEDLDKFNSSSNKPTSLNFIVKP